MPMRKTDADPIAWKTIQIKRPYRSKWARRPSGVYVKRGDDAGDRKVNNGAVIETRSQKKMKGKGHFMCPTIM